MPISDYLPFSAGRKLRRQVATQQAAINQLVRARYDAAQTTPQRAEGITACRWARFDEAEQLVSYANARDVLLRANAMIHGIDWSLDPAQGPVRR